MVLRNPISKGTNGTKKEDIIMHKLKSISTIKHYARTSLLVTGHWWYERPPCRWWHRLAALCMQVRLKSSSLISHIFLSNDQPP